jgi:hypothetical protein
MKNEKCICFSDFISQNEKGFEEAESKSAFFEMSDGFEEAESEVAFRFHSTE